MSVANKEWFEVDKEGLGKALTARGIEFAVGELVQNAWDADGVRNVAITLVPVPHSPSVRLAVEDDSPAGFTDLGNAFKLFGQSTKGKDPTKRGKWDIGEKLVFALARSAVVSSTTGTVTFDERGRHVNRKQIRIAGSRVEALLPMTREDLARCEKFIARLIPPTGLFTTLNDTPIPHRSYLHAVKASLETQIADDAGMLRSTYRECEIHVHLTRPGEKGMLYELGLPVQETGDEYHYDVQQRVPVGLDRNAVSGYYLNSVRAAVLGALANEVQDPKAEWVDRGLEHYNTTPETVKTVLRKRFGAKVVAADPTDPEAGHRATAAGFTVVHGGSLTAAIWEKVRQADALPRAGRLFPTIPTESSAAELIPEAEWTEAQARLGRYVRRLGAALLGFEPSVRIIRHPGGNYSANWKEADDRDDAGTLTFNASNLLDAWWPTSGITDENVELVLHEFAHHWEDNHLSDNYHAACCKLGAKIRRFGNLDWE